MFMEWNFKFDCALEAATLRMAKLNMKINNIEDERAAMNCNGYYAKYVYYLKTK